MRYLIFLICIFCSLQANAQNYSVSFAGTGASTTVTTVKVENLMKGTTLTLNGNDILHLIAAATGIYSIKQVQSPKLRIYPNPMTDNSTLEVFPPVAGNAAITIYEIIGRPIAQIQSNLENIRQEFRISGIKKGLYIINVKGNNYQFSGILLSNSNSNGTIRIEKVNSFIQAYEKEEIKASKGTLATIDMAYTTGDRLKFTGISGIYTTVKTDIPTGNKTISFNFAPCTDGDNNNYSIVEIGAQVWMAENLKTTKYSNGDLIGTTTPATLDIRNESSPKYQWAWDGIESNVAAYGRLYTGYSVNDSRNLCPTGWNVPTQDEWTILTDFLGGLSNSGGKLKGVGTAYWLSPNTGATNETGFTALPGGFRASDGVFNEVGINGYWWPSSQTNSSEGWYYKLVSSGESVSKSSIEKSTGFMVRCLKSPVSCPGGIIGNPDLSPIITLNLPAPGSSQLSGYANNINAGKNKVVIYVQTNMWFIQPFAASPYTNICSDGSWTSYTHSWDRITVLIVDPASFPASATLITHPSLEPGVLAWTEYPSTGPETIDFSGFTWGIKTSGDPFDPGPNYWSNDTSVVHLGADGLHLKIKNINGRWQCGEIHLLQSLGYGIYTVQINSRLDQLDLNTVAAPLFTYSTPGQELDFEFSGMAGLIPAPNNGQFVVQPWTLSGNILRYVQPSIVQFTSQFEWRSDHVKFLTWKGWSAVPAAGDIIQQWNYTGASIPPPGQERVHMNIWLLNGLAPAGGVGDEMIIKSFTFKSN